MESSSDSSDEDLSKLNEAIDTEFINDDMFKLESKKQNEKTVITRLPSLRRDKIDDDNNDEQFNFLPKVTPEFRNYVSKQLTRILDKQLAEQLTKIENCGINENKKRKRLKSRVKLFKDSKHFIKIPKYDNAVVPIVDKKPNSNRCDDDDDDDEEKFRSIAVNPDDILSQKETKSWSKRSKAPVYRYKQTPNGLIEINKSDCC